MSELNPHFLPISYHPICRPRPLRVDRYDVYQQLYMHFRFEKVSWRSPASVVNWPIDAFNIVSQWHCQANFSWRDPGTILGWIADVRSELGSLCLVKLTLAIVLGTPFLTASYLASLPLSLLLGWNCKFAFGAVAVVGYTWLWWMLFQRSIELPARWVAGYIYDSPPYLGLKLGRDMMTSCVVFLRRVGVVHSIVRPLTREARHDDNLFAPAQVRRLI